ncbi:MAG TPA: ABC transporter permease [Candidatus Acidoferrum sp.]|nr:ABC transporter permease [Candidatus Acidoferrum sp.]
MSLLSRLKGLLQIRRLERDLDEELRAHIEMRMQDNIAAGMSPQEARYDAQRRFGNSTLLKEDTRAVDIVGWMETTGQNLRYAGRTLRRSPGFTLVAVLTLALGIGANTAIFSIVNTVVFRPLPYKDSSRIFHLSTHTAMFPTFNLGLSWLNLQQIRSQASALEQAAAYTDTEKTLTGSDKPAVLTMASVTDGFFEELGATAQLGRLFTEEETQPGQHRVVVLSDKLWRTRFGADPGIVGKTLNLDREPYVVVGVAGPNFAFPGASTEAWHPLGSSQADRQNPTYFMLQTLAKLRKGEKIEKTKAQLDAIAKNAMKDYPQLAAGYSFSARPLLADSLEDSRDAFLMLLAAATFVLLIACANLASLLLARGSGRQREMALRAALGASRGRLLHQGLVESGLLALIGGAVGIVLAAGGIQLFKAIAPAGTPRLNEISLDWTLLWFSLLTSLLAGIVFGIVPARRAARMDPNEALKEGAGANLGGARSARQSRLGNALVTLEVAFAFVLIVGSVLMTLTLSRLLHQDPGFRTDHLLSFDLPQPPEDYGPNTDFKALTRAQAAHLQEITARIQQVPGVSEVTASDHGVLGGMMEMQGGLVVDGAIPATSKETRTAYARYIYPEYFRIMSIPLLRGREFTDRDSGDAQSVVIVNTAMAREYWGTLEVLGKRISVSTDDQHKPVWNEVVGVVADAREVNLRSKPAPTYFFSLLQGGTGSIHLLVRTLTDPDALATTLTRQIWAAYPDQPITHLTTMSRNISESVGNERLRSVLLAVFAGIGFAIALVGVYGVISYSVSRRVQEIGIRMALGAVPSDVLRMVIRQGLLPVALGVAFGAAGAFGLTGLVASQLYGVKPSDPATFIGATALVLGVALFACYVPARRAMRLDPMVALRHE